MEAAEEKVMVTYRARELADISTPHLVFPPSPGQRRHGLPVGDQQQTSRFVAGVRRRAV
jgi:hypothetical protein